MSAKNDVIEIYKGVPIRYSNVIRIRTSATEFKNIIDIVYSTDLCISDIVKAASQPCLRCVGMEVMTINSSDKEVKVPKGLFKESKSKWSGVNLVNQSETNKRKK
jgi:hypothetical protein